MKGVAKGTGPRSEARARDGFVTGAHGQARPGTGVGRSWIDDHPVQSPSHHDQVLES